MYAVDAVRARRGESLDPHPGIDRARIASFRCGSRIKANRHRRETVLTMDQLVAELNRLGA